MTQNELLVLLKERLIYDPNTGIFLRNRATAGSISGRGYVKIRIGKSQYYAHRLAWLYTYGEWPSNQIDHINRVKTDNRMCNLRDVSQLVNAQNSSNRATNTSGHRGVTWHKEIGKWMAQISVRGKVRFLGYFDDKRKAAEEYEKARKELHVSSI